MRSYATPSLHFSIHKFRFSISRNDGLHIYGFRYPHEIKTAGVDMRLPHPLLTGLNQGNSRRLGWSKYRFALNAAHCLNAICVGIGEVASTPHDVGDGGGFNIMSIPKQDLVRDGDLYIYKTRSYNMYPVNRPQPIPCHPMTTFTMSCGAPSLRTSRRRQPDPMARYAGCFCIHRASKAPKPI